MQIVFFVLIICAVIGLLDTVYLTIKHYEGAPVVCGLFDRCDIVTTSKYSTIFGFPISLLGAIYYFLILILIDIYLFFKIKFIPKIALAISTLSFLFSVWLVYLQLFILKSICPYCMLSATTSTIIFGLLIFINYKSRIANSIT
ncbi:MAG TPA: vitamin K epoxide reductase family protein [Candidatus Paceibacterota bacterium]|nr:vitamin K epoxide reductase family protein [Candidatus Paceibacterota bacterium]HMP18780.1 vitamin K epoxide reductase family protein [Candidatus Paceibacterota bacterium]HMP85506.1 vitamin K epoxide reductase family protein [Candidatus Paceibacterota bacterium]